MEAGAFGTAETARIVGISPARVRSWARAGICRPERVGTRFAFSFQDLVMLRTAHRLLTCRVPFIRVRRALSALPRQVPRGLPLSGVRVYAGEGTVLACVGDDVWRPESGQWIFPFARATADRGHGVPAASAFKKPCASPPACSDAVAVEWFERAVAIEAENARQACFWYRRALHLDPNLGDAFLNLGRLLHEGGDAPAALRLYREAVRCTPGDPVAHYNVGVALEDRGDPRGALDAYRTALRLDASLADAHFNAGRILESMGARALARRHFGAYQRISRQSADT